MNKFVLTAAMAVSLGLVSGAAMAEHHEGHDKGAKMMEKIDANGDGMVSRDEFLTKHEEKFNEMDADDDGNLTQEEMEAARKAMKEKWEAKKEAREETAE